MGQPLVPDDLWEAIEPLLPKEPPKPKGGRPRVPDRAALGGIVFILHTGYPWHLLPTELGCGSGWTCRRRLRDWQNAGVCEKLYERLLIWLGNQAAIDWGGIAESSSSARSPGCWAAVASASATRGGPIETSVEAVARIAATR